MLELETCISHAHVQSHNMHAYHIIMYQCYQHAHKTSQISMYDMQHAEAISNMCMFLHGNMPKTMNVHNYETFYISLL